MIAISLATILILAVAEPVLAEQRLGPARAGGWRDPTDLSRTQAAVAHNSWGHGLGRQRRVECLVLEPGHLSLTGSSCPYSCSSSPWTHSSTVVPAYAGAILSTCVSGSKAVVPVSWGRHEINGKEV